MCMWDDSEPWTVFRDAVRTAAKPYKCDECARTVERGERYYFATGLGEYGWNTFHVCLHCRAAAKWLEVVCSGWMFHATAEDLGNHVDGDESYLRNHRPQAPAPAGGGGMTLKGKDRGVWLAELERAHRDGGDVELRGNGIGWAGDKVTRFALVGAMAACRDYRRRSFLPGRTVKGHAIRVAAYSGAKRLENLTVAEAIAHAAKLKALADTLNAEAGQIRRWALEAEQAGRSSIGRRAA